MGDIFREIDEELRQEHYEKLWRKYGKYVIAGAVAIVVLVSAFVGWRNYQTTLREAQGLKFNAAILALEESKTDDASAILNSLTKDGDTGYGLLARFQEAALLAKKDDEAAAKAIYESIASDESIAENFRDLALILLAYKSIGTADSATMIGRLEPLSQSGNPWRFSALEIMGYIAQKSGDGEKAKEYFRKITDDPDAPSNLRARAAQFLDMIGG